MGFHALSRVTERRRIPNFAVTKPDSAVESLCLNLDPMWVIQP